jgi:hypothetical protein
MVLNSGAGQGVIPGLRMQVLADAELGSMHSSMALIEVTATEAQRSQARAVASSAAVQQGWKVQEVQQP